MRKILILLNLLLVLVGARAAFEPIYDEPIAVSGTNEHIEQELIAWIQENEMAPQEPRLDAVFDFVPGLHGLSVDFELSLHNMLANGTFDPSLIVAHSTPFEGDPAEFKQYPMYKGNEQGNYVALLINVAWGHDELNEMLDILDELEVSASLFFEGRYASKHEEQVRDVFNRGHIVGNHSYSHPANWLSHSYDQFKEEIVKTNEILSGITGEQVVFFAPPGGAFNDTTVQAAFDQDMYTILWTADTIDWRGDSASTLINRVMKRISPGGLILTHPKPETVKALEPMITQLREQGYEFKTVDQIISGERLGFGE